MANEDIAQFAKYQARRDAAKAISSEQGELLLHGGGGGGPMDPNIAMKEYIDARDDAIESRLASKLDQKPSTSAFWGGIAIIVGTLLTVTSIVLACLAFGSDRFNGGLSASPIVAQVQGEQRKVDEAQDAKLEVMDRKLDILIERSATEKAAK